MCHVCSYDEIKWKLVPVYTYVEKGPLFAALNLVGTATSKWLKERWRNLACCYVKEHLAHSKMVRPSGVLCAVIHMKQWVLRSFMPALILHAYTKRTLQHTHPRHW